MKNWMSNILKWMNRCLRTNLLNWITMEQCEMFRDIYIDFYKQLEKAE